MICYVLYLIENVNAGPFGIKPKGNEDVDSSTNAAEDEDNPLLVDLSDEELMEVMEQFALMSEEERDEAFQEVVQMLGGDDDPEMIAAVQEIMNAVKSMDNDGTFISSSSSYIPGSSSSRMVVSDEELAKATGIALEMIFKSDWSVIYNKRNEILDSLISSGKISVEDGTIYKSDNASWEKVLKSIWEELQSQAIENGNVIVKDSIEDEHDEL